jgi:hypothetical protein
VLKISLTTEKDDTEYLPTNGKGQQFDKFAWLSQTNDTKESGCSFIFVQARSFGVWCLRGKNALTIALVMKRYCPL